MNRILLLVITLLGFTVVHGDNLLPNDTLRYDGKDSIPNCQDDTNNRIVDPVGPIPPPIEIEGDAYLKPIDLGTYSGDFTISDLLNTTDFNNMYSGRSTRDIFYKFTISVPMNVIMTHEGSLLEDTYMSLLGVGSILIESNDNYSGDGHCSDTLKSFIQRQLAAGTYYVVSEGNSIDGYICTNITGFASNDYGYPTIPSAYSTEPGIAVGAMGGAFSVSPMGGATYGIPIDVPMGVGGFHPQLSIVYNSQSGNGLCGYGTNLSGLSVITRGVKDIYHDGTAQGMKYLADDALYLDGVRLILVSGTAGQNGAIYSPESDPFTTVTVKGNCTSTTNSIWFEVKSSDGMVYEYGNNTYSRLSYTVGDSQRIHSWYISRAQQPTGNYMTYNYLNPSNFNYCVYPDSITYGDNANQSNTLSNVIKFVYEERTDVVPIRFDGQQGSMDMRLKSVTGKTNGETYRSYILNYNTIGDGISNKFSRLISVTEKNAHGDQLPATQLTWSYLPSISYSSSNLNVSQPTNINAFASFPFNSQYYMSGDMNGDGLSDIIGMASVAEPNFQGGDDFYTYVYSYYASLTTAGAVEYVSGHNYKLPPNIDANVIKAGVNNLTVIDIDGNGISELIVPYFSQGSNYSDLCVYALGQDFNENDYCIKGLYSNTKPVFATGDVDNDGKAEVLFVETTLRNGAYPLYLWVYNTDFISGINTQEHQVFDTGIEGSLSLNSQPKTLYVADMNGNGLQDLFVICENCYYIFWNQGGAASVSTYSDSYKTTGTNVKAVRSLTPGDFNGDGLLDFLSNTAGSINWYFYSNNGDGTFSSSLVLDASILADQSNTALDDDMIFCQVIDLDSDGKTDVVISKGVCDSDTFDYVITKWFYSTGSALVQKYSATSKRIEDTDAGKYITGDFDGDGRAELVNYGYDCRNSVEYDDDPVWRIYKNGSLTTQSGKITSVTGSFGATTGVSYSTLTTPGVYTRGVASDYPAPKYTIPLHVVRETIQSNGAAGDMATTYSYSGLRVHLQGKGMLGFTSTTSSNATLGITTVKSVTGLNSTFYIPSSIKVRTYLGNNYDYNETITSISITNKGQKKYFAYPSQIVETDIDGNTVTNIKSCNTTYGYINAETSTYGEDMYRSVSYSNYVKAGGSYHPQTVVSSQRHPDDSSPFSTTVKYTYNTTTGTVATKMDNYGTSKPLTTNYTYDSWGNLISQESTGSGITTCTTNYEYDATHRFLVRIYTSPASSVTKYTYDVWGNVLTKHDSINSYIIDTIKYTYDKWDNLIKTKYADGSEVICTRGWNNDSGKRYFVLTQGTSRPWVKTWYDSNGREVCTESVGANNVSVVSTVNYNSKGQVASRSSTEGDLSTTRSYIYDYRGRITSEQESGGIEITYSYSSQGNGTHNETVSENSRATTYVRDAWGNLKSVTTPMSSLSNTYSSNGGIKTTTSGGATWTFQYDDRGNRISMTDPDAGTTTYVFDALGRETNRTDSRNIAFVTNYDYLGRVTQRKAGSSTINYTYGSSGTGQMHLISESNGTWTKSYTYDALGRVTQETMSKGNTISKSRTYTYDSSNGLLSSRTMPGGKTVQYTYDAYGNTTGVDFESGTIAWSLTGYNGLRTTSDIVLDNYSSPFKKAIVLDQYGYLDSLKITQTLQYGVIAYQDEKYIFDSIRGNLMQRQGVYDVTSIRYSYDSADRLLTATDTYNNQLMAVTYAANGNITSKTGIGSYTYGNTSKPHAVAEVDNTNGSISHNYQEVSYNSWGKISGVWQTDATGLYTYNVIYGPDLQRVESWLDRNQQTEYEKFYWDDYEEKTTGSLTTRYWYINGPDGLIGVCIEEQTPNGTVSMSTLAITDHLGSIEELCGNNNGHFYGARYDEWGNREKVFSYYLSDDIDRGFCGHEHIEELGRPHVRSASGPFPQSGPVRSGTRKSAKLQQIFILPQ